MCTCSCLRECHDNDNKCHDCECDKFKGCYQWPQWSGYWWYSKNPNRIYYFNEEIPDCLGSAGKTYPKDIFRTDQLNFTPVQSNPFFWDYSND